MNHPTRVVLRGVGREAIPTRRRLPSRQTVMIVLAWIAVIVLTVLASAVLVELMSVAFQPSIGHAN